MIKRVIRGKYKKRKNEYIKNQNENIILVIKFKIWEKKL